MNIFLELTPVLADHLAKLLNAAQFSGRPDELKATLANHDELIAAFNSAVKAANREYPDPERNEETAV